MLKQLTGIDATFLYMETTSSFGHVSSLSIYERPNAQFQPYETVRAQIDSRLPLLEPFRRKLVPVPLELDHPYWVNDPDFDLDFHVRHIALPPPGDDEQLATQVSRIIGRPMDRTRPLWEVYVFEGLKDPSTWGLLTKVHHATVDGAAGAEMLTILLDTTPEARPRREADDPWRADRVPSQFEMLGKTLGNFARRPGKIVQWQFRAARELSKATRSNGLTQMVDLVQQVVTGPFRKPKPEQRDQVPALPLRPAPATPFNKAITPHRRFAFRSSSLDDIKALKNETKGTVNDVVMAVCAGALRRYLADHGALTDQPLVAMIPVSIRTGKETDKWTNRVSSIFSPIPTHLDDPLERVKFVSAAMTGAKERFDLIPADVLVDITQFAPPALATRAMRLSTGLRIADRMNPPVNLVISNVPGPRQPLYMGGAQLRHYYPVSTVTEGQGLNITVQSYMDRLDFGLVACRELVPDLWDLVDMCVEEISLLAGAAGITLPSQAKARRVAAPAPAAAPRRKPARRAAAPARTPARARSAATAARPPRAVKKAAGKKRAAAR